MKIKRLRTLPCLKDSFISSTRLINKTRLGFTYLHIGFDAAQPDTMVTLSGFEGTIASHNTLWKTYILNYDKFINKF